ncbi:MAG: hypothetical protein RIM84_12795 [Alphaproteobacteria bacterium]
MRGRGEYLIELHQVGAFVKVSAIDPVTGTEVSITGPATAGEAILSRNAINKLQYVLRKNAAKAEARRRGIEV